MLLWAIAGPPVRLQWIEVNVLASWPMFGAAATGSKAQVCPFTLNATVPANKSELKWPKLCPVVPCFISSLLTVGCCVCMPGVVLSCRSSRSLLCPPFFVENAVLSCFSFLAGTLPIMYVHFHRGLPRGDELEPTSKISRV